MKFLLRWTASYRASSTASLILTSERGDSDGTSMLLTWRNQPPSVRDKAKMTGSLTREVMWPKRLAGWSDGTVYCLGKKFEHTGHPQTTAHRLTTYQLQTSGMYHQQHTFVITHAQIQTDLIMCTFKFCISTFQVLYLLYSDRTEEITQASPYKEKRSTCVVHGVQQAWRAPKLKKYQLLASSLPRFFLFSIYPPGMLIRLQTAELNLPCYLEYYLPSYGRGKVPEARKVSEYRTESEGKLLQE